MSTDQNEVVTPEPSELTAEPAAPTSNNPYLQAASDDNEVSTTDSSGVNPETAAADARASNMIGLVNQLIDVLERENVLLATPRSRELGPVVKEKQTLFVEYEKALKELGDIASLVAQASPDIKGQLFDRAKVFDTALRENEVKLDAMVRTSQHIMQVISKIAKKKAQPIQTYGRAGTTSFGPKTSAPVAVNETL